MIVFIETNSIESMCNSIHIILLKITLCSVEFVHVLVQLHVHVPVQLHVHVCVHVCVHVHLDSMFANQYTCIVRCVPLIYIYFLNQLIHLELLVIVVNVLFKHLVFMFNDEQSFYPYKDTSSS